MNATVKCLRCKKPIITKGHIVFNREGRPYVLCPFTNCQTINFLPFDVIENGNTELRDWNISSGERK